MQHDLFGGTDSQTGVQHHDCVSDMESDGKGPRGREDIGERGIGLSGRSLTSMDDTDHQTGAQHLDWSSAIE